jgi:hypothetical protein
MSIWDDPKLQPEEAAYFKFEKVGDTAAGVIKEITSHTFDDGKTAAQIVIVGGDGSEFTVTAGQLKLKAALAELRPEVGDHISIKLSQVERRQGGKTLKHFEVNATRNGAPLTPPGAAGFPPDPLAGLTDAQRQAILAAQSSEVPF